MKAIILLSQNYTCDYWKTRFVRKRKCTFCRESEHMKGILMGNLTSVETTKLRLKSKLSSKSHLHASDCFINNERVDVRPCTSAVPWNIFCLQHLRTNEWRLVLIFILRPTSTDEKWDSEHEWEVTHFDGTKKDRRWRSALNKNWCSFCTVKHSLFSEDIVWRKGRKNWMILCGIILSSAVSGALKSFLKTFVLVKVLKLELWLYSTKIMYICLP